MNLVLDTESTTYAKGNPFSRANKLMCVGLLHDGYYMYYDIEHSGLPYNEALGRIAQAIERAELIIGFNIKYDLHWIRRYIPSITSFPPCWDCQLAEFILNNQTTPMPSLDSCAIRYGLPPKLDTVDREYWSKGIDTTNVPTSILKEYNRRDCQLTLEVYEKQKQRMSYKQRKLFSLHCADLLVLEEMEYRGLLYNTKSSLEKAQEVGQELLETILALNELVGTDQINWNSPQQVSAVLYGGTINVEGQEEVSKPRKDGTIRVYQRKCTNPLSFERLVEPLDGSALQVGFSINEPTLRSLKPTGKASKIIELILKQSELDKLNGTYYTGIPNLIEKMDWELDTIHGQLNQCVARTGRLSSSRPNMQNFDERLKPMFRSRHVD